MISYQVIAEFKINESEYESEILFRSKQYKEAKAKYDSIEGLYSGADLISLVKDHHNISSDILLSKANPPKYKQGDDEDDE